MDSRVFSRRPDGGVAGGGLFPAHDDGFLGLHERMRRPGRARLGGGGLAEEIVLFDRGEAGVRVGRADHAELVGIDAELVFQLETVLERRAGVLELEHLRLLEFAEVEVALVPALEVGELVVGREERMRLAVALDLRGFVEALPLRAGLGILAVDLLAGERLDDREHAAVAQVAVVRDGEHVAAGLLLVRGHPLPQVAGIVAAQRLLRGVRLDPAGLVAVVAEDDVAVQVVAAGVRGPLVADEGREAARIVRLVRRLDRLAPGRAIGGRAGEKVQRLRELSLARTLTMISIAASAPLPDWIMSYHLRPVRVGQHLGVAREELREEAHVVRVIGHHEEVERTGELDLLAAGGGDLLALGEAIRVLRPEPGTERAGVHRERRVHMRVAEERPRGKVAARVRRVRALV